MLRLTAAAVAEPISQSPNSAGGRKGPRRNPGPYFCEGTITDLVLKFPGFVLLGVGNALALEPVDQADT